MVISCDKGYGGKLKSLMNILRGESILIKGPGKVSLKKLFKPKMHRNRPAKQQELRMVMSFECRAWGLTTKDMEEGIKAPV